MEPTNEKEVSKAGRMPDYSGDGLAVWVNVDKNNNEYLSVKVLGGKPINCFQPIKKEEPAAASAVPSTKEIMLVKDKQGREYAVAPSDLEGLGETR